MEQLGNAEPTTEEQSGENQQPEGTSGDGEQPCSSVTLAVYRAELIDASAEAAAVPVDDAGGTTGTADAASARSDDSFNSDPAKDAGTPTAGAATGGAESPADIYPDGFTGALALQNLESFDEHMVGEALGRMAHLLAWTQALEARLVHRMEQIFRDRFQAASGRIEHGMAFSLAASECAAILNVPEVTGQRLLSEANRLCGAHSATLAGLEEGRFSYQHAQVVLEQCQNVPAEKLPGFEADLLKAAEDRTRAQFSAKARRLREKRFPETISKRHLSAFEQRKVILDREEDGMSCLSAWLRAAEAQQIYTALSTAARGEQAGGDSRSTDQLRADILAQLLMGGSRGLFTSPGTPDEAGTGDGTGSGRGVGTGRGAGTGNNSRFRQDGGHQNHNEPGNVGERAGGSRDYRGSGCAGTGTDATQDEEGTGSGDGSGATDRHAGPDEGIVPRAEIMVLISAETLFGADDQPAELHGYGPISAEEARRLARNAAGWTGLAQDPKTGEILGVGRRRKVPAGLRRWLRARDGTCRFPGCRVSTANSDIDHTIDWACGGPTDHGNLEHLCRRHHRFKTLGYWKASQSVPGVIEWTSPTGRVYRTEPFLELDLPGPAVNRSTDPRQENPRPTDSSPKNSAQRDSRQEQAPPF